MSVKKEIIPAGTIILHEKPFVYALSSKFRTECCDFCFKKGDLYKCSRCKYVYYCGRACQKEGWAIHKQECQNLKMVAPKVLPDSARMLYRLIKKLERVGDLIRSYYTEKHYRTFKDLMSHYPNLKQDQKRMEHLSSLYGVLCEFMGCDTVPNSAELMGMYGRMCVNSFNICNQELQSLGTGIYLGASVLDHSCKPNALAVFEGTTIYIRTLEPLPCLDFSKIFICYIDVLASTKNRQSELLETYYFLCQCERCLSPECSDEMDGACCPNNSCDNFIDIKNNMKFCTKCGSNITEAFIETFKEVEEFTNMHLDSMKSVTYLDACKVCLKRQQGVLYKHHLKRVKTLDLAFESCIDLQLFEDALEYGLQLIESYYKYYGEMHPLTGLLNLKLCKLLLFKERASEAVEYMKQANKILKITHGVNSSLYKQEVIPLYEQCMV